MRRRTMLKDTSHPDCSILDAFQYVDTAFGGPHRRGKVRKLADFQPRRGAVDCFRSVCRFTAELAQHADQQRTATGRRSVAGYAGPALADFLPFDFDAGDDPTRAMADASCLIERLNGYGVPRDAIRIYFSGSKGIHLEVPAELFGGFTPSTDVGWMKRLATRLAEGL